ncbi:MAG: apolipoprotein N-acyltransferase [Fimbriimonadales bacterium]|nr:apolipoprotein N-acyltransferase [Fimbriimonadales bacterium]
MRARFSVWQGVMRKDGSAGAARTAHATVRERSREIAETELGAWGWTVASGALCGLAFPPVGWWWTVLFAPALWLLQIQRKVARASAWLGLWWGLAFGVVAGWHTALTFAQQAHAEWLGGVAWTLALLWFTGWIMLFGYLVGHARLAGWAWVLLLACLWTAVAWVRSLGALGFPWAMLSLGIARQPLLLQPAELGGVWLTEWLIIAWNGALVLAWQGRARLALAGLAVLGTVWVGYGLIQMRHYQAPPSKPLSIAVFQPRADTPLTVHALAIFDQQMDTWLRHATRQGAQWAVLPETVEPLVLDETENGNAVERLQRWQEWAKRNQITILLGASRFDGSNRNSALCISPRGEIHCYNKVKPMVFTEWSPPPPFNALLRGLGITGRTLKAGSRVHALQVESQPPVGTIICGESLFGWVARAQVQDGAQWLAVMSNDYWLIGRPIREQYADFCVLRAIETRRWIARSSTVGLSGLYMPAGKCIASLPMGKPNVLVHQIEPRTDRTLYVRWGDWWAYLCVLMFVILALAGRRSPTPK